MSGLHESLQPYLFKLKTLLYIASFLIGFNAWSQGNPEPKKISEQFFPDPDIEINTPAFQKKKGFTNYEEMMTFLNTLQAKYPNQMNIRFIGESQKGKKIPLVSLSKQGVENPLRVWIQGGLHGNEPGSSESTFYLMQQLLEDQEMNQLLNQLSIAIVPMANIDGYEKQDRYAANGLDLNRDQTKFSAPESVVLKEAFNEFKPEVALDLHEYNAYRKHFARMSTFGISSIYDAMFLYSGNLNVPAELRTYTNEVFVEAARKVMDEHQLKHHPYMSTVEHLGEIQFRQGAASPRSSATSYALTNCVAALLEVRGVHLGNTSFKRRVYTAYLVSQSFLKSAYAEKEKVREEIAKANSSKAKAVVSSKRAVYPDTIQVIDLDTRTEISLPIIMRDGLQMTATKERERPLAYLIPADQEEILKRLKILGLELNPLKANTRLEVESFEITSYEQEAEKFEDVYIQNVKAKTTKEQLEFPAGTWVLLMSQDRSNLAIEVLEPEANNGFVAYEVVPTALNEKLPYFRCLSADVLQQIETSQKP